MPIRVAVIPIYNYIVALVKMSSKNLNQTQRLFGDLSLKNKVECDGRIEHDECIRIAFVV